MIITIALKKKENSATSTNIDNIVTKTIQWWTKSPYFHVEMIIKDEWFSTSPTVGAVYINKLQAKNDNYDYYDIVVDGRKTKKVLEFLNGQIGKKYDYWGLLMSTVIQANIEDRNKWFCSELVAETLNMYGIDLPKNSNEMTPGDIYTLINQLKK